jgi:hypothetical protein
MKVGFTYIPREKFVEAVKECGCELEEQASFIKIRKPGNDNQLVYVANGQSVARVDFSGFTVEDMDIAFNLGGEKYGRVHQRLRFDRPAKDIIQSFKDVLLKLGQHTEIARKKRERPVGLKGSARRKPGEAPPPVPTVVVAETPTSTIDRLVAELARKQEMAKKLGSTLSKKTVLEYETKIAEARKLVEG